MAAGTAHSIHEHTIGFVQSFSTPEVSSTRWWETPRFHQLPGKCHRPTAERGVSNG